MKKKLFIITTVPETLDTILKSQPEFLNKSFEVSLVSSPDPALDKIGEREKVNIYNVLMSRRINIFQDILSLIAMIRLLKSHKPDVVHSYTPKAGLIAMLASCICSIPVRIHTFTGLIFPTQEGFKKKLLILIDKIICKSATHIVPESEGVKKDLKGFNVTSKCLRLIGNGNIAGVDINYFDRFNKSIYSNFKKDNLIPEGEFVFSFVGRLNRDKGIKELIEAFLIQDDKSHLVIVGGWDDTAPIEKGMIEVIANHPRIYMLGFQTDIRPALKATDVLVLPSYREGFPNVVLQAGAMSIPVIATDISGCNEVITPEFNGWLVTPKDTEGLAATMGVAKKSSKMFLNKMSQNARSRVVERFERRAYWSELMKYYQEAIK